MTIKIDISLETSVTGTAHIKQLGNIPIPKRLLSTGYSPGKGKQFEGWERGAATQTHSQPPSGHQTKTPIHQANPAPQRTFHPLRLLLQPWLNMPEDNKPLPKPSKLQLQFHCRTALISHQRAGSGPPPSWAQARGPVALLPSLFNNPLPSACPERGPNPKTSTLAVLGGRMLCMWMSSSDAQAEPRTLPSKQLLPLTAERSFCHKHSQFVQAPQDHRRGFGPAYWMSDEAAL